MAINNYPKESGGTKLNWEKPFIRPLVRVGELTTPTTFSASTPDRHTSNISEIRQLHDKNKE